MNVAAHSQAQHDQWCRRFGVALFRSGTRMLGTMKSSPAMRLGLVVARLRRMAGRDGVFYDPMQAVCDVARALAGLPSAAPGMWGRLQWRDVLVEVKNKRAVTTAQLAHLGSVAAAGGFTGIVLAGPVDPLIGDSITAADGRRVPLVQVSLTRGVRT